MAWAELGLCYRVEDKNKISTWSGLVVNPMQRFSTWVRWISTIVAIVGAIVKDIVVDFIKKQPETDDAIHAVLKFLLDLIQQPWLQVAGWIFVGLVAGLWLDPVLRKLDRSGTEQRVTLGTKMISLGNDLAELGAQSREPMRAKEAAIRSCFASARKFRIWAPDNRVFNLDPDHAESLITDYLNNVGQMLKDEHFREAKQHAVKSKAAFAKAYAEASLR